MGMPRDLLGPFPCRGLTDTAGDLGDARQALNVEWQGDWLQPRGGSLITNVLSRSYVSVDLIKEFWSRGVQLLVVCGRTVGSPDNHTVDIYRTGEATVLSSEIMPRWNGRPFAIEYEQALYLMCPVMLGNNHTMWKISVDSPYITEITPFLYGDPATGVIPADGMDTGAYRGPGNPMRWIFGTKHLERMFVVQDEDPWNVWYSGINLPDGWPLSNSFSPFGDSQSPLTGLVEFNGVLTSFTRRSIATTSFSGQGLTVSKLLKENTGAISPQAICNMGNILAFLSDDGLLFLDNQFQISDLLARDINSETLRNLKDAFGSASLQYFRASRQLWLMLPSANQIFILDMRTGNWSSFSYANADTYRVQAMTETYNAVGTARPLLAILLPSSVSFTSRLLEPVLYDQVLSGAGAIVNKPFVNRWVSHGTPFIGQHTWRLFRKFFFSLRDHGNNQLRILWSTKGEAIAATTLMANQYNDITLRGPFGVSRVGECVTGTVPVLGVPAGYIAPGLGEQDFELSVSPRGIIRGRWIQLVLAGLYTTGLDAIQDWSIRRWRIDTSINLSNPREV